MLCTQMFDKEKWIRIASMSIAGAGALLILGLGLHRFLKDGSLWFDEALVARSVQQLSPLQYFGELELHQHFPRLYLLAIRGLIAIFGYETLVMRALPFAFFVLGTLLWMRLLSIRSVRLPLLLVVAASLNLIPTSWLVYSSMFKQYTLDVFLALLIFSIPDRTLKSILMRGERPWRGALLMLPWLVSYPYVIVLAGRCAGLWLWQLRRRMGRVSVAGISMLGAGFVLCGGILYGTDIRHTLSDPPSHWWRKCILTSDQTTLWGVLDHFTGDWYRGHTEFPEGIVAIPIVILLQGLLVVGSAFVLWRFAVNSRDPFSEGTDWGTRSLGALCTLAVLLIASVPMNFPLCGSRLTLFVLLPMQLMIVEGMIGIRALLVRVRGGGALASAMSVLLALSLLPAASRTVSGFATRPPPRDSRSALPQLRSAPNDPILMDPCSWQQARSLPDDWEGLEVFVYYGGGRYRESKELPREGAVWVLTLYSSCYLYGPTDALLQQITSHWQPIDLGPTEIKLHRARIRPDPLLPKASPGDATKNPRPYKID